MSEQIVQFDEETITLEETKVKPIDPILLEKTKERAYYMSINNEFPELNNEEIFEKAFIIENKKHNTPRFKYTVANPNPNPKCNLCSKQYHLVWNYNCLTKCNSKICKTCIVIYILSKLKNMKFMYTPEYKNVQIKCFTYCNGKIYIHPYISEDEFHNVCKKTDLGLGDKIFNITQCVKPDCNGILNNDTCIECESKVCFKCSQLSHEGVCDKNIIHMIQETIKIGETGEIQQCPKCQDIIFKDGGCLSMFCWKCSNQFTWGDNTVMNDDEFSYKEKGTSYYNKWKENLKLENRKELKRYDR